MWRSPQLRLEVMTQQKERDGTNVVSMQEFQGESHRSPRRLVFSKKHLDDPQAFWETFCERMRPKWNFSDGASYICRESNRAFHNNYIIPPVTLQGAVWWSGAASGPGPLDITDGTMNSALYQKNQKDNVQPSVCDLKAQEHLGSAGGQWFELPQQVNLNGCRRS